MTFGTGIVLIAIGAIFRFAITAEIAGLDINVLGNILMIVGALALLLGFLVLGTTRMGRSRTEVIEERTPTGRRTIQQHTDV